MPIDIFSESDDSNQLPENKPLLVPDGSNLTLLSAPPAQIRVDKIHRLEVSKCQHILLPESGGQITKKINICARGEGVPSDNGGLAEMAHALEVHLKEISEQEACKKTSSEQLPVPAQKNSRTGAGRSDASPATPVVQKEETFIATSGYGTNGEGAMFEYEMVLEVRHHHGDATTEKTPPADASTANDAFRQCVALKNGAAPVRNCKSYTPDANESPEADNISIVT